MTSEHLEQVFGGRRANLEAQAAQKTQDTKTHFSEFAVFSAFCTKNGVVTKTGDIGKTFSGLKNLAVLQGFGTKNPNELGYYRLMFLTTSNFKGLRSAKAFNPQTLRAEAFNPLKPSNLKLQGLKSSNLRAAAFNP